MDLNFQRSEQCPEVASPGIAIWAPSSIPSSGQFAVSGSFSVSSQEAVDFRGHLMKGVVLLVRGPYPQAINVDASRVLFDDDLREEGGFVRGFFNLDLFEHFGLVRDPNRYWLSASVLGHASNVLTIEVR